MLRLALVVVMAFVSISLAALPSVAEMASNFEVVGRHDLNARGMNAGMAIAGDCGYVGSRSGEQGSLILDLSDPAAPRVAGEIPHHVGSTMRELRAVAALDLLVVLNYRLNPFSLSPNSLDLYDVSDCAAPIARGSVNFGDALPHEFFLWVDPARERQGRVLAYVAMWGFAPNLRVIDLTDPSAPAEVATWDALDDAGVPSRIHSLTVSEDGSRAYLADWSNGLMVLDTSNLATDQVDAAPRLLTPPAAWLYLPGGNLHSAVKIPGEEVVVTTQEIYGPGTCPYGRLHVVDVSDPAAPVVAGAYGIAENDPAACGATAALDGAFTTHNPTVREGIAFATWYAGGLRAVDLRDPAVPAEAGVFVPDPLPAVAADDFSLGSYAVRMWSSPIIRDGLIYVVDIRNGLYVLRYTGPNADAIERIDFAEGNAWADGD
ncbi:MAG: LVIVD repeat-containing protein [Thermomicrobiales bacterium]